MTTELKHLGKQSSKPVTEVEVVPWKHGPTVVTLDATEFTSHCPVTGQPDFGSIVVEYMPGRALIETKSFKLYLWSYRDKQAFNEEIVSKIADDLFKQAKPIYLQVTGVFNKRGGIGVTAVAQRGEVP